MRDVRGNYSGRKAGLLEMQAQNRIRRSNQLQILCPCVGRKQNIGLATGFLLEA